MNKKRNIGLLFLAALIWGFAFSAQSVGNAMGPFTFNSTRCFLGGLVLLPVLALFGRSRSGVKSASDITTDYEPARSCGLKGDNLKAGILCGLLLCIASNLQQVGLSYTSAGKAGFITALYIVFVPVAGIFLKKSCSIQAWIGVAFSVVGMVFLCLMDGGVSGGSELKGDGLVLLCACAFTAHILVIDHYADRVNGVLVSCIQFFVCGVLTAIPAFLFEEPSLTAVTSEPVALLYAGIMSCGVAYTLQIVGQKGVNPTVASLVLCLESVFSVVGGLVILGETMGLYEIIGCVLMFAGIILAQIPSNAGRKRE